MRTVTKTYYSFSELSEEAKQQAINKLCNINVSYDWWELTYDDAKQVGLKITGFDLNRGSYVEGSLPNHSMNECIDLIFANHGEECETFKLATKFRAEWNNLVKNYSDGVKLDEVAEDKEYEFDQNADDMEEDFKNELCECYLTILRKEYEYQTSEEAIIQTIEANEYELDEEGNLV
jgi:hypothetical protein